MSDAWIKEERRLERQTDEGAQELRPSTREVILAGGGMWPQDDLGDTMIINMGPQHPSTHGVLRLMMELDGEDVLRIKPVIGYLHTGMEKTGEELTYVQGTTNVTRMDYASNFANELVYSMAVERLLDVEVPDRAVWIRMMMCELSRMASHLLFQATNGMDIGAVSMMLYGWREREEVLRIFEYVTGLRMNCNYIRPGGVAADLPDGWQARDPRRVRQGGRGRRRLRRAAVAEPGLAGAHGGARRHHHRGVPVAQHHRADPALDRIRLGPAQGAAVSRVRPGRVRHHLHEQRRRVRPLPHPALRDPRVGEDRAPVRRQDAGGRLPRAGQEAHSAAPGGASTNRWKRSSTTSSCSPRASRSPRARRTSRSSRPGARSAVTW